jgi:hypothetical protein
LLEADALLPVEFVAVTVKVYAVEADNPVTVIGDDPVAVREPGVEVAVNVVAAPPVAAAVYATVAVVEVAAVAVPIVGASGTSAIGVIPGISVLLDTLLRMVT